MSRANEASSSKEIKALINDSVVQVKSGAQLVNNSCTSLNYIVTSVKKVAEIIFFISSVSAQKCFTVIANSISAMILDIQFQDRVSQYIGTLVSALTIEKEALQRM